MERDPYRYFRIEAGELLQIIGESAEAIFQNLEDVSPVAPILRAAHTLKGAARVVGQSEVAEVAHSLEDTLAPYREKGPVSPRDTEALTVLVDRLKGLVESLDKGKDRHVTRAKAAVKSTADGVDEFVRLERDDLSVVLKNIVESRSRIRMLRDAIANLESLMLESRRRGEASESYDSLQRVHRALNSGVDFLDRDLGLLHEKAEALRLGSVSEMCNALTRAGMEAASATGKDVEIHCRGGHIRLESQLLSRVQVALLHMIRNAVVHGIETSDRRKLVGKSERGNVHISVEPRGESILFVCADDGAGVDADAIRERALALGLLSADQARRLSDEDTTELLFRSGFTTSERVSALSGRGVGLDVVRDTIAKLGGHVSTRNSPGRGVRFEISVPVKMMGLHALVIGIGSVISSIPIEAVSRVLSADSRAMIGRPDGVFFEVDGRMLPVRTLDGELKSKNKYTLLVIESESESAALVVDRLAGIRDVVIQVPPTSLRKESWMRGAWLSASGKPRVLFDPQGLLRHLSSHGSELVKSEKRARKPVLIIDDSLTTRMLEQSILESAGYDVGLAASGEEGLRKAREMRYGLFLVDVEMPGMNGFQFLNQTRDDPRLRDTPAIMVTSRASEADRKSAVAAGAKGYMVKGEFDEKKLLGMIRELLAS